MATNLRQLQESLDRGLSHPAAPEMLGALHTACINGNLEMIAALLGRGVDVNARDRHGMSALDYAVEEMRPSVVRLLVENGANVNAKGPDGRFPLHLAIDSEMQGAIFPGDCISKEPTAEIIELLIENGADIQARTENGETPLQCAQSFRHRSAQEVLLRHGAH